MNLRPIPGHDGYAATDDGRIFSLPRSVNRGNAAYTVQKRELKMKQTRTGYLAVKLLPVRKNSMQLVHRLVMLAFKATDIDRPHVNHINGVKTDNNLSNLEWTNRSENAIHSYRVLKRIHSSMPKGANSVHAKAVVGTNLVTGERFEFRCISDARSIGCTPSGICSVISGFQHTHRGMRWQHI